MTELIILTNPAQLPPVMLRGITATTFDAALAEYERRYGKAGRVWQYGNTFYFEAQS